MLEATKALLLVIPGIVKLIIFVTSVLDQLNKVFTLFLMSQMIAIIALLPFEN